jgi:hypothetical protein
MKYKNTVHPGLWLKSCLIADFTPRSLDGRKNNAITMQLISKCCPGTLIEGLG